MLRYFHKNFYIRNVIAKANIESRLDIKDFNRLLSIDIVCILY